MKCSHIRRYTDDICSKGLNIFDDTPFFSKELVSSLLRSGVRSYGPSYEISLLDVNQMPDEKLPKCGR